MREDTDGRPAFAPGQAELADLELLLIGAFSPLKGFMGAADAAASLNDGRLADGTPWPAPVVLTAPGELPDGREIVLTDPEGVPLATLTVAEKWRDQADWRLAGSVTALAAPEYGPFRQLRRAPSDVRAELTGDRPVLAVAARTPLRRRHLGQLRQVAEKLAARILVLVLLHGTARPNRITLGDDALVRAVLAARKDLPPDTLIAAVPLGERAEEGRAALLAAHVAAAYGATHLLDDAGIIPGDAELPLEVVIPEPWAYDTEIEVWRPAARIEPDHARAEPSAAELTAMLDRGDPIPGWFTPSGVAAELRRAHPPRYERGLTVFFTGLSGSGKSTIARGLADALAERGGRTVTLLDGDVVRRMLSAGLTFSRADRDLNIRRIGYVAAEITRHGGVAICAPIAPYAATRAEVRRMVTAVGDYLLIHVATPLEECERRDRKGLYAKARAGLIREFTGISDPYEEPGDADLRLDTTELSPAQAVAAVLDLLTDGGWVRAGRG